MLKFLINDARKTKEKFVSDKLKPPRLIITSPPYFDLKDYGGIPKQIGLGQKYDEYLHDVVYVFQQCYEISTNDASLWVVVDTFRKNGKTTPLPFDLVNTIKSIYGKKTWQLRDIVIWHKTKNTPWHAEGRFRNHFEYILFFTKGEKFIFNIDSTRESSNYKKWWLTYPERYNSKGRSITNIWEHTAPIRGWGHSNQNHMCSLPFALLEKIIEIGSSKGDLIFDPFGGSGSAIALASCMDRDGIAFDINLAYKLLFKKEVKVAAKLYWNKRQDERKKLKEENRRFRHQNIALRKLKSAFLLLSTLDTKKNYKTIVKTSNVVSNKISIILEILPTELNSVESQIKIAKSKIEKTMKTQIDIVICSPEEFINKLKTRKKWFVYDYKKFYRRIALYDNMKVYDIEGIISNISFSLPL